jgi:hypothetical protein
MRLCKERKRGGCGSLLQGVCPSQRVNETLEALRIRVAHVFLYLSNTFAEFAVPSHKTQISFGIDAEFFVHEFLE